MWTDIVSSCLLPPPLLVLGSSDSLLLSLLGSNSREFWDSRIFALLCSSDKMRRISASKSERAQGRKDELRAVGRTGFALLLTAERKGRQLRTRGDWGMARRTRFAHGETGRGRERGKEGDERAQLFLPGSATVRERKQRQPTTRRSARGQVT